MAATGNIIIMDICNYCRRKQDSVVRRYGGSRQCCVVSTPRTTQLTEQ